MKGWARLAWPVAVVLVALIAALTVLVVTGHQEIVYSLGGWVGGAIFVVFLILAMG